MPNSTLPPDNYLGDPERTTGEFQERINQLQNWVNTLQAELQTLSSTTLGEGAVRGVGGGGTDLRQADSFGSAADVEADQNLQTTDTVQFGRVTDAATPGDGDFDSDKLGYWEATVELNSDLSGNSVKCVRIGNKVTITFLDVPSYGETSTAASTSILPDAFTPNNDYVYVAIDFDASQQRFFTIGVNPAGILSIRSYRIDFSNNQFESFAGKVDNIPTISFTV